MSMRKSPSGYITGRPVVYPVVRLHNRSIAGHPYGTYTHVQCMRADTGEESTALVFNGSILYLVM